MRISVLLAVLGLALVTSACANDDGTLFADFVRPGSRTISLSRDVQPIFSASCALSGCHAGTFPESNLGFEPSRIFDPRLGAVGVSSQQVPGRLRIAPGDASASYVVDKIQGTQLAAGGSGAQMPFNRPPLSMDAIRVIRAWIDQGALGN